MARRKAHEREHDFMLVLSGISELTPEVEAALFEAGCDDATLSVRDGHVFLTFSRTAPSLKDAVLSAIRDVKKANVGDTVLWWIPGDRPMSTTPPFSDELLCVFAQPLRDIVGLVDDLLTVCRECGLQLDWQSGRCRVRCLEGDREEVIDVPLRTSAFRMMLARVAALCNERVPNSVSPYGGQGELSFGANSPKVFRVTFVNTLAEQKLELWPMTVTTDAG